MARDEVRGVSLYVIVTIVQILVVVAIILLRGLIDRRLT